MKKDTARTAKIKAAWRYAKEHFKDKEERNIAFVRQLKVEPCTDCKEHYPYWVMDFDHVPDRGKKKFGIGKSKSKTLKEILKELRKCDLVCSNCHRTRTYYRARNRFIIMQAMLDRTDFKVPKKFREYTLK